MKCAWLLTGCVFYSCAMNVDNSVFIRKRAQHIRHIALMKLKELDLFGIDRLIILDDPTKITHYILTGMVVDKPIELNQYVGEFVKFRTCMHAQDDAQAQKTFKDQAYATHAAYSEKSTKDAIQLNILRLLGQIPLPEDN